MVLGHSLLSAVVAMLLATKNYSKKKKKGKREEKGITESDAHAEQGDYHLTYDEPSSCRILDYCLWFLGSLEVSGIRTRGSHLAAVVCRI